MSTESSFQKSNHDQTKPLNNENTTTDTMSIESSFEKSNHDQTKPLNNGNTTTDTMSKEMGSTCSNQEGSTNGEPIMEAPLTTNAIISMNAGDLVTNPILQILSFRRIPILEDQSERYKIVLSDGKHVQLAIFPEKSNHLLFSDRLKIKSIVTLTNYVCRATTDSRTIIIFSLQIMQRYNQIIGKPRYLYKSQEEQMLQDNTTFSPNKRTKFGIHTPRRDLPLPESISPIKDLNPYQTRWTIKGRVTTKKKLRQFSNSRGSGQVFSFDILDHEGTKTRIVCFNDIAELHYDRVQIGGYYTVSKGSVKEANKQYNKLNSHMEITLDHSSILKCCDDDLAIGNIQYNFRPINDIANINNNTLVDIIGIVISITDISTVQWKDASKVHRRIVTLMDMSLASIDVNFWGPISVNDGEQIKSLKDSENIVVLAIRNGRVSEFKGKVINTTVVTILTINPSIPEAEALRTKMGGVEFTIPSLPILLANNNTTTSLTIASVLEKCNKMKQPLETMIKATIKYIKQDTFCYPSCPIVVNGKECKKKVAENTNKTWYCCKCEKTIPDCKYRYLLQVKLQDHTTDIWAVAFDEVAESLLHMSATELYMLQYDTEVNASAEGVIKDVFFNKFRFTISITSEVYNSEARFKTTITKATKLDFNSESKCLLSDISNLLA